MGRRTSTTANPKTIAPSTTAANPPVIAGADSSSTFSPTAETSPAGHARLHDQDVPLQILTAGGSSKPLPTAFPLTTPHQHRAESSASNRSRSPSQTRRSLCSSGHDPDSPGLSEAIAEPTFGLSDLSLQSGDMASKTTPFLRSLDGNRLESSPYGSMAASPDGSAANSDSESDDPHRLRRVRESSRGQRSLSSRRSLASRQSSSRLSEDLDGAALVSGLDGRFGLAEAPLAADLLHHGQDDYSNSDEEFPFQAGDDDVDELSEPGPEENSPNELVRASVPPTDNTTLSINTPRMWCLSVLFSILGSSTNLFFSLRYPSVAITPVIALLLVHPLGRLWDLLLKRSHDPEEEFVDGVRVDSPTGRESGSTRLGKRHMSWRLWLAQGKWNEKEHTCVYVSSNVAFGFAFATDVIVEQTQFYSQPAPIVYQLLLTISTQILGYGFAGMARRFLVRPSGMVWPGTLMSASMFSTLHKQENKPANGWTISRWKFFYLVWGGAFVFYFLPGLLMPALSYFSVITWFAPKSVVIANLFGVTSGLGLFPVTFDWAQITYVGSPLLVPFWAAMNVIGGLTVVMWIIAPIFYYSNVLYTSYMPILSTGVFDNTGKIYNVSKILTPEFLFDREAYSNYSRVFLPVTYMLSYGMQFAGLAALLTHTFCWHGKDIWRTWKRGLEETRQDGKPSYKPVNEQQWTASSSTGSLGSESHSRMSASTYNVDNLLSREDIHCRLMARYKDAPLSWYLITFASMTAIGMFVVE